MFIGLGTDFWGSSIFILPTHLTFIDAEFLPIYVKFLPIIFAITSAFLAFIFYSYFNIFIYLFKISKIGIFFYKFFSYKWYFDYYYSLIINFFLSIAYNFTNLLLDRGYLQLFGPLGLNFIVYYISNIFTSIQTGLIYNYAFVMFIGLIFFMSIILIIPINFFFIKTFILLYIVYLLLYKYIIYNNIFTINNNILPGEDIKSINKKNHEFQ